MVVLVVSVVNGLSVKKEGILVSTKFPKEWVGESNVLSVNLTNLDDFSKNVSVYSYLHDGSKSLSGGWTSNKQSVVLLANESKMVVLKNFLVSPVSGVFDYKVRVVFNGEKIDLSSGVVVNQTFKSLDPVSQVKSRDSFALACIGAFFAWKALKQL